MTNCLFCNIIAGEIPCHKIYEDENVLAFLDIKPLNPGHTLIVPKKHAEHLLESTNEEVMAVMTAAKKIAPGIMESVGAMGCNINFNVGHSAGQIIFHTHLHIIPRYEDDGYKEWCRTEDLIDNLSDVAERIQEVFERL
ncbi:MAG: Histidine triad (HIT) protein [Candidatus Uhrbacteria bacterium GW2011_GWE2_45_35]|uniref:Histidine triad (HIT) protein n=2 Tax=Candidatus Uhriibacteriota TaxID=1752732 RepID=A0A0G1JK15_9BACT|nr:MAG: Histidine triad (HIT) protein [Candidatus Uhrbacteria bacterium GW2011_GWF2_44_350]KKU09180.1 MAG: Histidine triad (HIT) protein [Candidatus Uhrbacteria bacterium GW2011_GWE2_45_35]HBR80111.1 diadenosine tetraphosphate hydrolase [Candidatus Uhrbacteria bacterium]HCU31213.1 diadenosine tetraphosphate hydrolase [Candidatus Uhrbacteria bacterium]